MQNSPKMNSLFGGESRGGFMDPTVVPGVIGPAPGGFDYYDLLNIFDALSKKARIVGFNLVEFMPSADIGGRGALVSGRIFGSVLGLIARQRASFDSVN